MTHLDAERISKQRSDMLASLIGTISASLFEALSKKMDYEHNSLLAIIESDAKVAYAKKALNKTLRAEYFVQKRLDTSHI